jgi:hypothetical protein
MNKQHILDEIRRTASENGGVPLGRRRFEAETGIRESDWTGRFWARWNDAVREAGFAPNRLNAAIEEDALLSKLAVVVREMGRLPVTSELKLQKQQDPSFPNHKVFTRLGTSATRIARLLEYCDRTEGFSDVAAICRTVRPVQAAQPALELKDVDKFEIGYVYLALMKVGREKRYKIGKADVVGRRTRQIAVQLPEDLELVHAISTDDAYGIEAYWHKRFAEKRRGGEWFELTAADVRWFKRRKFM